MDSVYQKFYSAVKALSNISLNSNFCDNISYIDNFLNEFRNITFMIQKNFNSDKEKKTYEELRNKYFLDDEVLKTLKILRNEIEKENPFDLVVNIECTAYLGLIPIPSKLLSFKYDKDILNMNQINTVVYEYIKSLNLQDETFFKVNIFFTSDSKEINIIDYAKHGIDVMQDFLFEFEENIFGNTNEFCDIKEKINKALLNVTTNNLKFEEYGSYIQSLDKFNISDKSRIVFSSGRGIVKDSGLKLPLKEDDILLEGKSIEDKFRSFVIMHLALYSIQKDLMPVFIIGYDEFYEIESFPVHSKAEIYNIINKINSKIVSKKVKFVFICFVMITSLKNKKEFIEMNHDEKMKNYDHELIAFSLVQLNGHNRNVMFYTDESKNTRKILNLINSDDSNFENFLVNPLIYEFKKSNDNS